MKKSFFILFFLFVGYSLAQAQECFVGKSQNSIMDSLSKTNYRAFDGQIIPGDRYTINFQYDVRQDSVLMSKLIASKSFLLEPDSLHRNHYWFVFNNKGICIISDVLYIGRKDYQRVISDLNAHYKNKGDLWIDSTGRIEVAVIKHELTRDFNVEYLLAPASVPLVAL